MSETSKKSKRKTAPKLPTSSPASVDGSTLSNLPAGPQLDLFGQEVAPAKTTARPAKARASREIVTSGRISTGSSASAALQRFLVSKLMELLDTDGSIEFKLTWKRKVTPLGLRYCLLQARARRPGDTGYSGWPTPVSEPANGTPETFLERKRKAVENGSQMGIVLSDLQMVAQMTSWPAPKQADGEQQSETMMRGNLTLTGAAMASWSTPRSQDCRGENPETRDARKERHKETGQSDAGMVSLPVQAALTSWATPTAMDCEQAGGPQQVCLTNQVQGRYSPWTTPGALEPENPTPRPSREATGRTTEYLGRQVHGTTDLESPGTEATSSPLTSSTGLDPWPTPNAMEGGSKSRGRERKGELLISGILLGPTSASSPAATSTKTASPSCAVSALNPAMSRWLQGYPATWDELSPFWKEWALVQQKLRDGFATPEAFSQWLVEIALAG
jgi:hypothetical protein